MITHRSRQIYITAYLSLVIALLVLVAGCSATKKGVPVTTSPAPTDAVDSAAHAQAVSHYTSGSVAEETGDLGTATIEYQLARQFDPVSVEIGKALVRVYMKIGQQDAALSLLEQMSQQNPANDDLLGMLAMIYASENRYDDSYDAYQKLHKIRPFTKYEQLRFAGVCYEAKHGDESLTAFENYIKNFGPDAEISEQIGRLYLLKRDLVNAEKAFHDAVNTDSTRAETYYILGSLAVQGKRTDEALADYFDAIRADSSEPKYWIGAFLLLNENKDYQRVVGLADTAIDNFPDKAVFYGVKGSALERLGQYDSAEEFLTKAITIDSSEVSAYVSLAYIYHEQKQYDKGAQIYSRALLIEPDNALVLNNYAYMLSVQNANLDSALAMVNRALEASEDEPTYIDTKCWILYRLGRGAEALPMLEKAMVKEPDNAEMQYHLGMIYQEMGRPDDADKAFRRAADLEPDNPEYRNLAR